ncbi:MAG: hypothetical protein E7625_07265 [Ruminococcaceae bacterium]|nr:hypothetical protein [Oscillospiraceae bacterium]
MSGQSRFRGRASRSLCPTAQISSSGAKNARPPRHRSGIRPVRSRPAPARAPRQTNRARG